LSRDSDPEALTTLFRPYRGDLDTREVTTWVNRPDHDDATCVEPVGEGD